MVRFLLFHSLESFCFCLCFCSCILSGCQSQFAGSFRFDADGPDEAQQFAPHGGDDLALVLACRRQPGIAFREPDLCLPGDLLDGFRHSFLSLAQPGADGWPVPITPGRFNNDAPEMRVARFGNAPASRSLAAGVLTGHRAAVTHQVAVQFSKRVMLPNSATIVTAEISAMPRKACKPLTTSCTAGVASLTASVIACSSRLTRSPM